MAQKLRTIRNIDLKNERVLLRTGWDVPLEKSKSQNPNSKITVGDDIRIRESLPTLRYLIEHDVQSVTIMFHVGRPEGKVVPGLSVKPVVERLIELLSAGIARQNPNVKTQMSKQAQNPKPKLCDHLDLKIAGSLTAYEISGAAILIKILENLRFDPREEGNDDEFAKELARDHDLYVNDAFSNCHRKHASMVAITKHLSAYAGLLVEDELKHLSLLRHNPSKPFMVLIGGAKIEDKMPVINEMATMADAVLLGGKTGLEYSRRTIGDSPRSNRGLSPQILPPLDDHDGYDIGPKTIAMFTDKINTAQTIFWNGNMGMSEDNRYGDGTQKIAQAIVASSAQIKIAGGGDTTAFIHEHGMAKAFTFLSSGGGATLDYLAGKEMPGLEPLLRRRNPNDK